MHVQVNASNGIANKEALERWANEYLAEHLARFFSVAAAQPPFQSGVSK